MNSNTIQTMDKEKLNSPNNVEALKLLFTPVVFVSVALAVKHPWLSVLCWSFFFTQTFILLHECGHLNFFKGKRLNFFGGYIFGFLSFIPFLSWMHMHNLHHRWTGWRDKDPTTERTVGPPKIVILQGVVNVCWWMFIPIFYLVYLLSNYWNVFKIKRFVRVQILKSIQWEMLLFVFGYFLLFSMVDFSKYAVILWGFFLSLIWKELIILTQHTHVEIPISDGQNVRPISYKDQVKYTRSFYVSKFFEKWFLFNFNMHEAHHAQPGLPAYYLGEVELNLPRNSYWNWFKQAKSMKGVDFIFKTSKHTGKTF